MRQVVIPTMGNYYLSNIFGEGKLTSTANAVAITAACSYGWRCNVELSIFTMILAVVAVLLYTCCGWANYWGKTAG